MAPRGQTLPQAATESAREARKSFFCELCQKGYARMNDFEAHEGSYDHQHRKRLKEMKQLTKDPNAAAKAERERKANEEVGLKSINLSLSGASGATTKKKPVFKSTLQPRNAAIFGQSAPVLAASGIDIDTTMDDGQADPELETAYERDPSQAKTNGWYEDRYNPLTSSCSSTQSLDPRKHRRPEQIESWEDYVKIAPNRFNKEDGFPAELLQA